MISIGDFEITITGTNMKLLTRMRHKEEKEIGVNNQGITQPLEVVQRPQFAGLAYTKGECSKVSYASETYLLQIHLGTSTPTYRSILLGPINP